jgi:predicted permease
MSRTISGFAGSSWLPTFSPSPKYDQPEQAADVYRRLIETVSAVPGVESAAVVNTPPLTGGSVVTRVTLPNSESAEPGSALYVTVSDGYLRTMGMRMLRGRWFTAADMAAPGSGVIVNAAMAQRYWPNEDPVGRAVTIFRSSQLRPGYGDPMPSIVIGVINDIRHFGFTDRFRRQVYVPYTREVWPGIGLLVRTASTPNAAIPNLRRAVREVLPDIPIDDASGTFGFRPLASFAGESLATQQYLSWLVSGFAASALLLAMIGIYGLTAYVVGQRTSEFGVRMALGATRRHILGVVISHAARPAIVGAAVGLVAAFALTRVLRAVLYETSPTDPATFALATLILLVVAIAAALGPARRATNVDPLRAIRGE